MAQSMFKDTLHFTSDAFVISAGCILFRGLSICNQAQPQFQICLIHQRQKDEWLLPKGRKNVGEDGLSKTALREVWEETGFRAKIRPVTMDTRATLPPANLSLAFAMLPPSDRQSPMQSEPDVARTVENCEEPFWITVRHIGKEEMRDEVKIFFWFIAEVVEDEAQPVREKSDGPVSKTAEEEGFDAATFFSQDEALRILTFKDDRELVGKAIEIMKNTSTQ